MKILKISLALLAIIAVGSLIGWYNSRVELPITASVPVASEPQVPAADQTTNEVVVVKGEGFKVGFPN